MSPLPSVPPFASRYACPQPHIPQRGEPQLPSSVEHPQGGVREGPGPRWPRELKTFIICKTKFKWGPNVRVRGAPSCGGLGGGGRAGQGRHLQRGAGSCPGPGVAHLDGVLGVRGPVHAPLAHGVGAHPDVLLDLVAVGEVDVVPVQLLWDGGRPSALVGWVGSAGGRGGHTGQCDEVQAVL